MGRTPGCYYASLLSIKLVRDPRNLMTFFLGGIWCFLNKRTDVGRCDLGVRNYCKKNKTVHPNVCPYMFETGDTSMVYLYSKCINKLDEMLKNNGAYSSNPAKIVYGKVPTI